ncbi:YihY/virulence factor BrkB family protein [Amnibacterium endophyticum]|uniref:YihY/virulence factor BrkB family protein n=1 Tax=Amnibacterium endophyticum TaxID=2109337 RepID=A0ABW4LIH9_9MICO
MPESTPRSTAQEVTTAAGISAGAAAAIGAVALIGRARGGRSQGGRRPARSGVGTPDDVAASTRHQAAEAPDPDAPSKPEGPEDLHKPTLGYSLKSTLREFSNDKCTDLAASLVYYAVLALGPGIIAIVSILGLLNPNAIGTLQDEVLQPALPPQAYDQISGLVQNAAASPAPGIGLAIGILGALWSASGYVGAFGRAMNRIYSIPEGRPIWKLRPTQLFVTVVVVVLVVLGGLLLVSGGPILEQAAGLIGIGPVGLVVFQIVKWPVLVLIAIAAVAILYYFSPNIRQPKFKWTSTGSVVALFVLALATTGLGLYLSFTGGGSYGRSYGPIAGVVIFLLWLWITNLALLFGAEFDAELERSRELQAGIAAEEQIQLPPRDTRQSDKKAQQHEKAVASARRLRESRGTED